MLEKDNAPDKIFNKFILNKPNEVIEIHNGAVEVLVDGKVITLLNTKVYFEWYPHLGTVIDSVNQVISGEEHMLLSRFDKVEVRINGLIIGTGYLSEIVSDDFCSIKIKMINKVVLGDSSIASSKIYFSLPNFRDFLGDSIKEETKRGVTHFRGRILLVDEKYSITLDKVVNIDFMTKEVFSTGGHIITYDGSIEKLDEGSMTHDEVEKILYKISCFLSFVNGYEIYPMLVCGTHEDEVLWTDFSSRNIQQYQSTKTWSNRYSIEGLNELWQEFSILWKKKEDRNVLDSVIKWYNQINRKNQYLESSIIISQTVLELLYNWYIVETNKVIIGKDSENINAANKIRLLLSFIEYRDYSSPKAFKYLTKLVASSSHIGDAIDAIVYIRNSIVHSQEKKRKELELVEDRAKIEMLDLSIWYIEIAILRILRFNGKIKKRIDRKRYVD